MNACEKDLELAGEYLEKKNASAGQLEDLIVRLLAYTEVLPPGPDYATTFSRLRLQAAQLKAQIKTIQSSLFDDVQRAAGLRNDSRLADALEVSATSLSRMRSGHLRVGATLIVSIHELTGWPIRDIKARLNLQCRPLLATWAPSSSLERSTAAA